MQSDHVSRPEHDAKESIVRTEHGVEAATAPDNDNARSETKLDKTVSGATDAQFPPPKTDKPRPHVCGTCGRSFARLEHLKRHERSHTKEKPFECPECSRCFARRDLLLRHQQKLHMINPTSSRPRNIRRESMSATSNKGGAKVRKNSVAGINPSGLGHSRPRANTISHIDLASLGFLNNNHDENGLSRVNSLGAYTGSNGGIDLSGLPMDMDYRAMQASLNAHDLTHGLPKLDMGTIHGLDMTNSLHSAPPMASFEAATGFNLDQLFSPGTTINPAQLHFEGNFNQPASSAFTNYDTFTGQQQMMPDDDDFSWMRNWNMPPGGGMEANEQAIDESSPSRISSGDSPADYNDIMSNSAPALNQMNPNAAWLGSDMSLPHSQTNPFRLESLVTGLPMLDATAMQESTSAQDMYFRQALMQQQGGAQSQGQHRSSVSQSPKASLFVATSTINDSPSISSSSMAESGHQSSHTSLSTDSITDSTRQALLSSLAQPSVFGLNLRKYSQPSVSSPLSPGSTSGRTMLFGFSLPSTADIRRYVDAFIRYAHPHLPVTHVPTLTFDAHEYSMSLGAKAGPSGGITGGGGCLILAMAAIGALYEYEHPVSKELFEAGKKMIGLYLEERRRADMAAVMHGTSNESAARDTPLWLVQAMLLNVIYGHQCGDRTSADIASNHCAALVSLARAAELARPPFVPSPTDSGHADKPDPSRPANDIDMNDGENIQLQTPVSRVGTEVDLQQQWLDWVIVEKRKRTLFAIFILSSLLNTVYNQTPTIMNSEILLDLPCEEELWAAESAQEWQNRGGLATIESESLSFAGALSTLLTANQRQTGGNQHAVNAEHGASVNEENGQAALKPSTFGCLVLINALHNYIWETRSRHNGRQWTAQETESMFSHIEPALNAWQTAWKANDHHRLERPNPFGLGALSADSIPLLDLAFVRLFVNLGRVKEAFWARDYDTMANELARGSEIVQHAEVHTDGPESEKSQGGQGALRRTSTARTSEQASSRREKHLRKAAFYAADSLTIACHYNLTYADAIAHELPIQSAMCFFDCSQVLAEWACTVQERVGCFLGILGRDEVDWTQVPAIMLLETEDVELLKKIDHVIESLENKRFQQDSLLSMEIQGVNGAVALPMQGMHHGVSLAACGYGSRLLRVVGTMLEKAAVWPVTHVMAKAIETQAAHMDRRAEASRRA